MISRSQSVIDAEVAKIAAMSPEKRASLEAAKAAAKKADDIVYAFESSLPFLYGESPFARIKAEGCEVKIFVGGAYDIKDSLKASGYTFSGSSKMWVKTFQAEDVDKAIAEAKGLDTFKVKLVR